MDLAYGLRCEVEIRSARSVSTFNRWFRQDIRFDDPDFDDAFVVRGPDEGAVKGLLEARARALMAEIGLDAERLVFGRRRMELVFADPAPSVSEFSALVARIERLVQELSARGSGYR